MKVAKVLTAQLAWNGGRWCPSSKTETAQEGRKDGNHHQRSAGRVSPSKDARGGELPLAL